MLAFLFNWYVHQDQISELNYSFSYLTSELYNVSTWPIGAALAGKLNYKFKKSQSQFNRKQIQTFAIGNAQEQTHDWVNV